jgi:hypothetical protein
MMKAINILAIAALTAAGTMLPLSASATAPLPVLTPLTIGAPVSAEPSATVTSHQAPGACRRAWTRVPHQRVPLYSEPTTASTQLGQFLHGFTTPCRHMQVGGRYNLCGAYNTGWILIPIDPYPRQGWIPNQCTDDPVLAGDPALPEAPSWPVGNDQPYHQQPGACRHAWMHTVSGNLTVRSEPRADAPAMSRIETPRIYPCRHMQVGGSYRDVCGADNTGWVLIPLNPYPRQGWIPSQCTADPVLL